MAKTHSLRAKVVLEEPAGSEDLPGSAEAQLQLFRCKVSWLPT